MMQQQEKLHAPQKKRNLLPVVLTGIALAFACGVLVYIGGLLLQMINFASVPEPKMALSSALLGAILGFIGSLIARNKYNREPSDRL